MQESWQLRFRLTGADGRRGAPPEVEPETLRAELDAAGVDLELVVSLVVGGQRELPVRP